MTAFLLPPRDTGGVMATLAGCRAGAATGRPPDVGVGPASTPAVVVPSHGAVIAGAAGGRQSGCPPPPTPGHSAVGRVVACLLSLLPAPSSLPSPYAPAALLPAPHTVRPGRVSPRPLGERASSAPLVRSGLQSRSSPSRSCDHTVGGQVSEVLYRIHQRSLNIYRELEA